MKIEEIKKRMKEYTDFYNGDILEVDKIDKATTKKELREILENHRRLMENMLADANQHLNEFMTDLDLL